MDASILREQIQQRISQRSLASKAETFPRSSDDAEKSSELSSNEEEDEVSNENEEESSLEQGLGELDIDFKEAVEQQEEEHVSKFEPWVLELPTEQEKLDGESSIIQVEYATPSRAERLLSSVRKVSLTKTTIDRNRAYVESLNAVNNTREDLEALGIVFLNLKLEAANWLQLFEIHVEHSGHDSNVIPTENLFSLLQHGDLLCSIANDLFFGECIKEFSKPSAADVMSSLHERENIKKFLKACVEIFHVPKTHVFDINDLHNNQNMPKVLLSLRAFAKCAERHLSIADHLTWPDLQRVVQYEEDDVLRASSEMSKIDVSAIKQLYNAGIEELEQEIHRQKGSENTLESSSSVHLDFSVRQQIVKTSIQKQLTERSLVKEQMLTPREKEAEANTEGKVAFEDGNSVETWLKDLNLQNYYQLFIQDGWDDLDTIVDMEEVDLKELGIKKRGHIRKLIKSIRQLGTASEPAIVQDNRKESWRKDENLPLNVDETRSLWKLVRQLQSQIKSSMFADKDANRAMGILIDLVEQEARKLVPFHDPIIIEIGWFKFNYGFLYETSPNDMTSLIGKLKARHPLYYCGDQLDLQNLEEFELRRPMHRGMDSTAEPMRVHWDDIEKIIVHILKERLQVNVLNHPVLLIEPPQFLPMHREFFINILAKKIGVPAVYISRAAPLAAFAFGVEACVVLDIGESRSTASAIWKGSLVANSVVHSPVAGEMLCDYFMRLMVKEGLDMKSVFSGRKSSGYMSSHTYLQRELANVLKEISCVVSSSAQNAEENASNLNNTKFVSIESILPHLKEQFLLLTHQVPYLSIPSTSYLVGEALFQPNLIQQDEVCRGGGLHHIVEQSIISCPESIQSKIAKNLIVIGGGAAIPGLIRRLRTELKSTKFGEPNIFTSKSPNATAWQGAATIVKEPAFQCRWIIKSDVKEKAKQKYNEGLLPLVAPEQELNITNRSLAAMHYLTALLKKERTVKRKAMVTFHFSRQALTLSKKVKNRHRGISSKENLNRSKADKQNGQIHENKETSHKSTETKQRLKNKTSIKQWIDKLIILLRREAVPENTVLDVKLHLARFAYEDIAMDEAHATALLDQLPRKVRNAIESKLKKITPQMLAP